MIGKGGMGNIIRILTAGAVVSLASGCSQSNFSFGGVSGGEQAKLATPAFTTAGINAGDGYPSENLRVSSVSEAAANFTQDCSKPVTMPDGSTMSRYDFELQQAQLAASSDQYQKTIPVQFALSFGSIEDGLAYWAHRRAILSGSNPGQSFIPVGGKTATGFSQNGVNYGAYYVVDHSAAKNDYIYGRKCFFDTVTIQGDIVLDPGNPDMYDFMKGQEYSTGTYNTGTSTPGDLTHGIHYMYYGWCAVSANTNCATASNSAYGPGNFGADTYPNRLFGSWPHLEKGQPQVVKLYVADLRDGEFGLSTPTDPIVRVQADTVRGAEIQMNVKQELDLKTIYSHRDEVVFNLSSTYVGPNSGITFAGMSGIPQLLSNIQSAAFSGTLLASQYTPLVVDLGEPGITLSSLFGGTYFNMNAQTLPGATGLAAYNFPFKTAWLGGSLLDVMGSQASNPNGYKVDVVRQADDGFLVIPNSDGSIYSTLNLFGSNMVVNGQTYANGFEALRALANKNCNSANLQDQYFGPWDGDLYFKTVQVWVDKNRSGSVDPGELMSLKDAGVVAINTCYVLNKQEEDAFGNGTSMRSAFLYQSGEDITGNQAEILNRLNTGYTSSGLPAEFRLIVDVLFQADPTQTLDPGT